MCVFQYTDQNHILLISYSLWFIPALIRKADIKPSPPEPKLYSDNKYHEFSKVFLMSNTEIQDTHQ